MDNALNEKLDLSALHLGIISVGALLGAVVTLVVCILAVRIITVLLRRVLGKTTLEQRVSKYIVSTVRFVLWVVTVLIVAQQLGIPVTSLVALFSVVSLAVSLAVQNVLANVAGGLVLLVTKPFTVGDYIDTPSGEGTVREMSLTYTFLETMEGQRLAVPNSTLSSGKIINYSTLATRRLQHKITASYDDAAADVRRACLTAVGADGQRAGRIRRRWCTSAATARAALSTLCGAGRKQRTTGRRTISCWRRYAPPLTRREWRCATIT